MPATFLSVPVLLVGSSRTTWGGVPLPLDLGLLGMNGCSLLISPDAAFPLVNQGGRASWSTQLPAAPRLIGSSFFVQGMVVDPGANPFGATTTNAAEAVIGLR